MASSDPFVDSQPLSMTSYFQSVINISRFSVPLMCSCKNLLIVIILGKLGGGGGRFPKVVQLNGIIKFYIRSYEMTTTIQGTICQSAAQTTSALSCNLLFKKSILSQTC